MFALAREPLEPTSCQAPIDVDRKRLAQAYTYCASFTREHSKTFYLASNLLPPAKKRAVCALYAFCRVTDDLIDHPTDQVRSDLEAWRKQALVDAPSESSPIVLAWADTLRRYAIPVHYAHQLVDGVARDLDATRYATFEELAEYAYGVASTVGLMSMHIVGFDGPEAVPYAVKLGVALQMTNILRDVREDWQRGRLYLPQDELAAFGLHEGDIAAGRTDERWLAFMRFQIERNRRLYAEGLPGVAMLHRDGRFAIAAAIRLYAAILQDIEAHKGDVFHRRAHVSQWTKLRRLPAIWWQARTHKPERGGGDGTG